MQGAQAQSESERKYWLEDEMSEPERREFEGWLEDTYWAMRAREVEMGEDF